MNGWVTFVVFVAAIAANWLAMWLAYGNGFRAAKAEACKECDESLGIERETRRRMLEGERRRCDARMRGARLRFEPSVFAAAFIERERSRRLN